MARPVVEGPLAVPVVVAQPAGAAPVSAAALPSLTGTGIGTDHKAHGAINRVLKAARPSLAWPREAVFQFGAYTRAAGLCKRCLDTRVKAEPPLGTRPAIKAAPAAAGNAASAEAVLLGG